MNNVIKIEQIIVVLCYKREDAFELMLRQARS